MAQADVSFEVKCLAGARLGVDLLCFEPLGSKRARVFVAKVR